AQAVEWIRTRPVRMVWLAGKGGVGKSTCAAAIACVQSETRRVCVVSTDPAGSLSEIMGVAVAEQPVAIEANLYARQIDAIAEFDRMREQYRASVNTVFQELGLDVAAQLDRRVVESLWDFAPPGIDEIISLVEIMDQAAEFDTLVIDCAPTGHFLRLIEMPEIALDWVHALLRLLVKYRAAGSLDALARDLLAFAKRLRRLKLDLSAPDTTAVFLVTLAEPMVRAETARLSSALQRAGLPVAALILNRADDGERIARGTHVQRIRAPMLRAEAVGPAALRSFVEQWSLIGE
ncbi:MAG TPA: ArsA family ATPase, partial [Longimicrobiales bacterium]